MLKRVVKTSVDKRGEKIHNGLVLNVKRGIESDKLENDGVDDLGG